MGHKGNQNAVKQPGDRNDAQLNVKCRGTDYRRWQRKAGKNLSKWVVQTLNEASR